MASDGGRQEPTPATAQDPGSRDEAAAHQQTRHVCKGAPDSFNCARCAEGDQDNPDPRVGGWFS